MEELDIECGELIVGKSGTQTCGQTVESGFPLMYGDVVKIGSKDDDDIRIKDDSDENTSVVLNVERETGFVKVSKLGCTETLLNNEPLCKSKYLIPGDSLWLKGKVFIYRSDILTEEDVVMLRTMNSTNISQVPKNRHSAISRTVFSETPDNEPSDHRKETSVIVCKNMTFETDYIPSITPSKTNYHAKSRLEKRQMSEGPKSTNLAIEKRNSRLRRHSLDLTLKTLASPFAPRRSSVGKICKSRPGSDLITWVTPPILQTPSHTLECKKTSLRNSAILRSAWRSHKKNIGNERKSGIMECGGVRSFRRESASSEDKKSAILTPLKVGVSSLSLFKSSRRSEDTDVDVIPDTPIMKTVPKGTIVKESYSPRTLRMIRMSSGNLKESPHPQLIESKSLTKVRKSGRKNLGTPHSIFKSTSRRRSIAVSNSQALLQGTDLDLQDFHGINRSNEKNIARRTLPRSARLCLAHYPDDYNKKGQTSNKTRPLLREQHSLPLKSMSGCRTSLKSTRSFSAQDSSLPYNMERQMSDLNDSFNEREQNSSIDKNMDFGHSFDETEDVILSSVSLSRSSKSSLSRSTRLSTVQCSIIDGNSQREACDDSQSYNNMELRNVSQTSLNLSKSRKSKLSCFSDENQLEQLVSIPKRKSTKSKVSLRKSSRRSTITNSKMGNSFEQQIAETPLGSSVETGDLRGINSDFETYSDEENTESLRHGSISKRKSILSNSTMSRSTRLTCLSQATQEESDLESSVEGDNLDLQKSLPDCENIRASLNEHQSTSQRKSTTSRQSLVQSTRSSIHDRINIDDDSVEEQSFNMSTTGMVGSDTSKEHVNETVPNEKQLRLSIERRKTDFQKSLDESDYIDYHAVHDDSIFISQQKSIESKRSLSRSTRSSTLQDLTNMNEADNEEVGISATKHDSEYFDGESDYIDCHAVHDGKLISKQKSMGLKRSLSRSTRSSTLQDLTKMNEADNEEVGISASKHDSEYFDGEPDYIDCDAVHDDGKLISKQKSIGSKRSLSRSTRSSTLQDLTHMNEADNEEVGISASKHDSEYFDGESLERKNIENKSVLYGSKGDDSKRSTFSVSRRSSKLARQRSIALDELNLKEMNHSVLQKSQINSSKPRIDDNAEVHSFKSTPDEEEQNLDEANLKNQKEVTAMMLTSTARKGQRKTSTFLRPPMLTPIRGASKRRASFPTVPCDNPIPIKLSVTDTENKNISTNLVASPNTISPTLSKVDTTDVSLTSSFAPQYEDVTMEDDQISPEQDHELENHENVLEVSGVEKIQVSPKNDLRDISGLKHFFARASVVTPKVHGVKSLFTKKSPLNELSNVEGVRDVLRVNTPLNDLSNIQGVKNIFKNSPLNDLRNIKGFKQLYNDNSPCNDLTDVEGVQCLFKRQNTPSNDLRNVEGVKETMRKNSPCNDLSNVYGLKRIFDANTPKNDLSDVEGVRNVFKRQNTPKDNLCDVRGVGNLFKSQHTPKNDLMNIPSFKDLYATEKMQETPNISQLEVFDTPKAKEINKRGTDEDINLFDYDETEKVVPKGLPSTDLFDVLVGRQSYRTYGSKTNIESPEGKPKVMNDSIMETFESIKKKRKTSRRSLKDAGERSVLESLDLFHVKPFDTPVKTALTLTSSTPKIRMRSRRGTKTSDHTEEDHLKIDEGNFGYSSKQLRTRNLENSEGILEKDLIKSDESLKAPVGESFERKETKAPKESLKTSTPQPRTRSRRGVKNSVQKEEKDLKVSGQSLINPEENADSVRNQSARNNHKALEESLKISTPQPRTHSRRGVKNSEQRDEETNQSSERKDQDVLEKSLKASTPQLRTRTRRGIKNSENTEEQDPNTPGEVLEGVQPRKRLRRRPLDQKKIESVQKDKEGSKDSAIKRVKKVVEKDMKVSEDYLNDSTKSKTSMEEKEDMETEESSVFVAQKSDLKSLKTSTSQQRTRSRRGVKNSEQKDEKSLNVSKEGLEDSANRSESRSRRNHNSMEKKSEEKGLIVQESSKVSTPQLRTRSRRGIKNSEHTEEKNLKTPGENMEEAGVQPRKRPRRGATKLESAEKKEKESSENSAVKTGRKVAEKDMKVSEDYLNDSTKSKTHMEEKENIQTEESSVFVAQKSHGKNLKTFTPQQRTRSRRGVKNSEQKDEKGLNVSKEGLEDSAIRSESRSRNHNSAEKMSEEKDLIVQESSKVSTPQLRTRSRRGIKNSEHTEEKDLKTPGENMEEAGVQPRKRPRRGATKLESAEKKDKESSEDSAVKTGRKVAEKDSIKSKTHTEEKENVKTEGNSSTPLKTRSRRNHKKSEHIEEKDLIKPEKSSEKSAVQKSGEKDLNTLEQTSKISTPQLRTRSRRGIKNLEHIEEQDLKIPEEGLEETGIQPRKRKPRGAKNSDSAEKKNEESSKTSTLKRVEEEAEKHGMVPENSVKDSTKSKTRSRRGAVHLETEEIEQKDTEEMQLKEKELATTKGRKHVKSEENSEDLPRKRTRRNADAVVGEEVNEITQRPRRKARK